MPPAWIRDSHTQGRRSPQERDTPWAFSPATVTRTGDDTSVRAYPVAVASTGTGAAPAPAAGPGDGNRPLRSDAERNRRRILRAAAGVFTERGLDATLDDVARHAGVGVGVGTVYRRFPEGGEVGPQRVRRTSAGNTCAGQDGRSRAATVPRSAPARPGVLTPGLFSTEPRGTG